MLDVAASANLGLDLIRMNRLDTVTTGARSFLSFPKGHGSLRECSPPNTLMSTPTINPNHQASSP